MWIEVVRRLLTLTGNQDFPGSVPLEDKWIHFPQLTAETKIAGAEARATAARVPIETQVDADIAQARQRLLEPSNNPLRRLSGTRTYANTPGPRKGATYASDD